MVSLFQVKVYGHKWWTVDGSPSAKNLASRGQGQRLSVSVELKFCLCGREACRVDMCVRGSLVYSVVV